MVRGIFLLVCMPWVLSSPSTESVQYDWHSKEATHVQERLKSCGAKACFGELQHLVAFGIEMIRGRIMIVEVVTGCHNQLGKADLLNARILIKVVILAIQRENVDLVPV